MILDRDQGPETEDRGEDLAMKERISPSSVFYLLSMPPLVDQPSRLN